MNSMLFGGNDISKGSFAVNNVRQTFSGAFEILKTASYVRASIVAARQQNRMVSLRPSKPHGGLVPEEMSILSSVMGITQEVSLVAVFRYCRCLPFEKVNQPSTAYRGGL